MPTNGCNVSSGSNGISNFSGFLIWTIVVPSGMMTRIPDPPEEKIAEILTMLQKNGDAAEDCSECGYRTCREFAIDIAKGLTSPELCISMH